MKLKFLPFAAITMAVMLSICFAVSAAGPAASSPRGESSSSAEEHGHPRRMHVGGDFLAYKTLADMLDMSASELADKYPQKTAWQIAKTLGKLDDLKKAFLSAQKSILDKMTAEGALTAEAGSKIYEDLRKRVAAIDGVNTVILGRPGYKMMPAG